jgi:hypothetical protein
MPHMVYTHHEATIIMACDEGPCDYELLYCRVPHLLPSPHPRRHPLGLRSSAPTVTGQHVRRPNIHHPNPSNGHHCPMASKPLFIPHTDAPGECARESKGAVPQPPAPPWEGEEIENKRRPWAMKTRAPASHLPSRRPSPLYRVRRREPSEDAEVGVVRDGESHRR